MNAKRKTKIRKNIRYIYMLAIVILFVFSFSKLLLLFSNNQKVAKKKEISYTNNFNYTYDVDLVNNKFITAENIDAYTAYVTGLINNINLNLNYKYTASEVLNTEYKYKVIGKFNAVYLKDGEQQKIWNKEYILKDESINTVNEKEFNINEVITLNLSEHNNLLREFEEEMAMSVDANYLVVFKIETISSVDGQTITNEYETPITINLGEKTTQISGDNDTKDTKYFVRDITEAVEPVKPFYVTLYAFLAITSILVLRHLYLKTENANNIRNQYKQELNRILKLCQDKIVQINSKLEINDTNAIEVKDFGEILKVSEELFKPILCWKSTEEETWFMVMSNNILYRFIFKR